MTKTLVATDKYIDPLWEESLAVAAAGLFYCPLTTKSFNLFNSFNSF